ncbi:MAG: hypothetical protein ACRD2B_12365 [Terriglobia bacterium]
MNSSYGSLQQEHTLGVYRRASRGNLVGGVFDTLILGMLETPLSSISALGMSWEARDKSYRNPARLPLRT